MKIQLFVLAMLLSCSLSATWVPFGPQDLSANKVCFNLDFSNHWAVCHDKGIAIYDHLTQSWTDHETYLPVIAASYLDGDKILMVMGDGTDSDGIYTFDPATGHYDVMKYLDMPNFLYFNDFDQKYFIGYHLGMLTSSDGFNWSVVDTLNNRNIISMDGYQHHYVVSEMDNLHAIWYSENSGESWEQAAAGAPMISCLGYDNDGKLYGVFPDESWSSGLWSSTDFGETWIVEFWSTNMSCVGFDAVGNVFTGWGKNSIGTEEGIAHYNTQSGVLNFKNEGLDTLLINSITFNPWMSAIALFCCTEKGAYVSYFPTRVTENVKPEKSYQLLISPNPVKETVRITYHLPDKVDNAELLIYQADGHMIGKHQINSFTGRLEIDCTSFPAGVYFVVIEENGFSLCERLVIQ